MSKKIIVTGANGQLGSEIKFITGLSAHTYLFTDITDLDLTKENEVRSYLNLQKPDIIINCAAYTAVDKAEEDIESALLINAEVPALLRRYCDESLCRLIHISTDYVFSGEGYQPLQEANETVPKSIYGQSKLKGEQALKNSDKSIIIRTSWLYSGYGNNFVKSMMRLMNERKELRIVFDQIGTPTYAADLAAVVIKIAEAETEKFIPGIYHYSNEGVASWYDFAIEIREITGADCKILPIETKDYPLPAPRPWYSVMNKEKIKKYYNVEIPHWKSSLKDCIMTINKYN